MNNCSQEGGFEAINLSGNVALENNNFKAEDVKTIYTVNTPNADLTIKVSNEKIKRAETYIKINEFKPNYLPSAIASHKDIAPGSFTRVMSNYLSDTCKWEYLRYQTKIKNGEISPPPFFCY